MKNMKRLISLGLAVVVCGASAQTIHGKDLHQGALSASPTEIAAFRDAGSAKFIIAAISKCEKIRDRSGKDALPQITHSLDAQGRIASLRYGNTDFSVEYNSATDTKPVAINGLGFRLPMKQSGPKDDFALAAAKARVIMYREVRSICGLPQVAFNQDYGFQTVDFGVKDPLDDDSFPPEYLSYQFWDSYWEPSFDFANKPQVPSPQCVSKCQNVCDVVADFSNVTCGALGALIGIGNPGAGIVVGVLCGWGVAGGKVNCRSNCETNTDCRAGN